LALRDVDEKAAAFDAGDCPAGSHTRAAERDALGRIDDRLAGLTRHMESAASAVAAVEALLAADEHAARAWAESAAAARRRLAGAMPSGI
jgi:hypothetical protein